ncbi:ribbon-helix-helix domain-containing protein [Paracoccus sp. J39]|uniref:ribbon-helix-helix domain-containing protein n=1 Tax=Paracoccus sp. J39 TaxID=935848 RepID=UPI0009FC93A7
MPSPAQYGTSVSWCQYREWRKPLAPPKKDTEAINLRLPRELIEAIDNRRRDEPDLPTRPEMIRRALVQWLEMTDPER